MLARISFGNQQLTRVVSPRASNSIPVAKPAMSYRQYAALELLKMHTSKNGLSAYSYEHNNLAEQAVEQTDALIKRLDETA